MNTVESRFFLLKPVGGLLVPRGGATRVAVFETVEGECRIYERDEICAIVLWKNGRQIAEQLVAREVAKALLRAMENRSLIFHDAEIGEWMIRVYEGKLWGLVVGEIPVDQVAPTGAVAPAGWKLGAEVTGEHRFLAGSLAALDEQGAQALVREFIAETV